MPLNSLPATITLLIALSMATERGVEIVKSLIPWLDLVRPEPVSEGRRRAAIQALAVLFGFAIAFLTWPIIAQVMNATKERDAPTIAALGLLASGGSAFWNSLLGIVLNLKVMKGAEARAAVQGAASATLIPDPEEGVVR
ncbi:MAG: hypothetical protein ACJ8J0_03675 [Longimicrobiaceae bacterium]